MNKVEGKVSDWCPKCKNCKGITREKDKKISELNQTISDQEVTIKALLITIKEMCKEEM